MFIFTVGDLVTGGVLIAAAIWFMVLLAIAHYRSWKWHRRNKT